MGYNIFTRLREATSIEKKKVKENTIKPEREY